MPTNSYQISNHSSDKRESGYDLDGANSLRDLSDVRSNRLEKLLGDREGQYSIRINRQWRICFSWSNNDAYDVEIVDYH